MDFCNFMRKIEGKPLVEPPPEPEIDVSMVRNVSPANCLLVLNAQVSRLDTAFSWDSTPQGGDYWWRRAEGAEGMSEEDYAYVQAVYTYYS